MRETIEGRWSLRAHSSWDGFIGKRPAAKIAIFLVLLAAAFFASGPIRDAGCDQEGSDTNACEAAVDVALIAFQYALLLVVAMALAVLGARRLGALASRQAGTPAGWEPPRISDDPTLQARRAQTFYVLAFGILLVGIAAVIPHLAFEISMGANYGFPLYSKIYIGYDWATLAFLTIAGLVCLNEWRALARSRKPDADRGLLLQP